MLRGDSVKDDSGAYAVFTEKGSSASQMTAAKEMDVISKLPGCDGQAADALSAYTRVRIGGRSQIAQNSKVRMSRRVNTSSTTHMAEIMVKHWRSSGTSWTKFVRTPTFWSLVGETVRSSSFGTWVGKKYRIVMSFLFIENTRIIRIGTCGWKQDGWKEAEHGSHVEK